MKTVIKIIINSVRWPSPGALFAIVTLACLHAAPARAQPKITLPTDDPSLVNGPPAGIPRPSVLNLPRENQIEVPLDQPAMAGTAIGGYGELTLNAPSNGPAIVDMRRLVLYIGHNFNEHLRFYGELEAEHAVTSSSDKGEFEVEQAFLDYVEWRAFNLRAGVIIMPVGIVNVYHEPPTFNGVDRPLTDQLVIPSTWREPGAGFFGEWRGFRYQAYAVNGFNASGFSAAYGLREGHQEAQLALARDWGIVARLDYTLPFFYKYGVSADVGASFYFANADENQPRFTDAAGNHVDIGVTLVEGDARFKVKGLELRGEVASVWIGHTDVVDMALAAAALQSGQAYGGPVGSQLLGGYVELGYNVLHALHLRSGMQLVPFGRYEHVDTQYRVAADAERAPGNEQDVITAGLTFRPIAEVALKLDFQEFWLDRGLATATTHDSWNAGVGFMF